MSNALEQLAVIGPVSVERQSYGFTVRLDRCEIKEGIMLRSAHGRGSTVDAATTDYLRQIAGKVLVFDASTGCRREVHAVVVFVGQTEEKP